jgi:hypothetical protein
MILSYEPAFGRDINHGGHGVHGEIIKNILKTSVCSVPSVVKKQFI